MSSWLYAVSSSLSTLVLSVSFFYFFFRKKISEISVKDSKILASGKFEEHLKNQISKKESEIKNLIKTQEKQLSLLVSEGKRKDEKITDQKREIDSKNEKINQLNREVGQLLEQRDKQIRDIESLRNKESDWEEREKKWERFARGYTLEDLILREKKIRDKRSRLTGDSTDSWETGAKLEREVEDILNRSFPNHLNAVSWKREMATNPNSSNKGRIDFIIEFYNSRLKGTFKVLIECKNLKGDDDNAWMIVRDKDQEKKHSARALSQINSGLKQLIRYSETEKAHLCLLLTTAPFKSQAFGFGRVNLKDYLNIDPDPSHPEIFLVHPDVLEEVLVVFYLLSKSYDPDITISQKCDEWLKDDYVEFLSRVGKRKDV